jgi:predicted secreted protein
MHSAFFLCIFSVLILNACAMNNHLKTLGIQDNNTSVTLKIGDSLLLELAELSTAGYQWEVAENTLSQQIIIQEDFIAGKADGGAGMKQFRIKAIKAGQGTIQLKHWQSWENAVDTTFTLNIQVLSE